MRRPECELVRARPEGRARAEPHARRRPPRRGPEAGATGRSRHHRQCGQHHGDEDERTTVDAMTVHAARSRGPSAPGEGIARILEASRLASSTMSTRKVKRPRAGRLPEPGPVPASSTRDAASWLIAADTVRAGGVRGGGDAIARRGPAVVALPAQRGPAPGLVVRGWRSTAEDLSHAGLRDAWRKTWIVAIPIGAHLVSLGCGWVRLRGWSFLSVLRGARGGVHALSWRSGAGARA